MLAFSYIRFSRPEQMSGDSWRRQTAATARYCLENGLSLSDKLEDLGVSAYRGKNSTTGALGDFLAQIKAGTVPAGSRLIVESLDRVTRQSPMKAIALFTEIIEAGVSIVTLADGTLYDQKSTSEIGNMMMMVMVACRAHEESLTKSKRLCESWANKRAKGGILTARSPDWLDFDGKKFCVNKHGPTIKKIYEWGASGLGQTAILRKIVDANIEPIGRSKKWFKSYICKILNNRAVMGKHQHMMGKYPNRKPVGDEILGYYPRVISDQLFAQNQENLQLRKITSTKTDSEKNINIFSGLIFDAEHHVPIWFFSKGKKSTDKKLYSAHIKTKRVGISYFLFQMAILKFQHEVDWNSFMNRKPTKVAESKGNLTQLLVKRQSLEKAIEDDPELSGSLIKALKKCIADINEIKGQEQKIESVIPAIRYDLQDPQGRAIAAREMKKNIERINCWTKIYAEAWVIEVVYRIGFKLYILIQQDMVSIIAPGEVADALAGKPLILKEIKDNKELAELTKAAKIKVK